jgi:hypothetical protein
LVVDDFGLGSGAGKDTAVMGGGGAAVGANRVKVKAIPKALPPLPEGYLVPPLPRVPASAVAAPAAVAAVAAPAAPAAAVAGTAVTLGSGPSIDTGGPTALCSLLKHTFKHAPHCDTPPTLEGGDGLGRTHRDGGRSRSRELGGGGGGEKHVYPLLVTGVGRSATKFMQESLKALGAQVSMEASALLEARHRWRRSLWCRLSPHRLAPLLALSVCSPSLALNIK